MLHHLRTARGQPQISKEAKQKLIKDLSAVLSMVKDSSKSFPESSSIAEISILLSIVSDLEDGSSGLWNWMKVAAKAIDAVHNQDIEKAIEVVEIIHDRATIPSFNSFGFLALIDEVLFHPNPEPLMRKLTDASKHDTWKTLVIALTYVGRLLLETNKLDRQYWIPIIVNFVTFEGISKSIHIQKEAVILLILLGEESSLPEIEDESFRELLGNRDRVRTLRMFTPEMNPCGLPEHDLQFIGRSDELRAIASEIAHRPVVLCGMPGFGKTSIATQFLHLNRSSYDVIHWIESDSIVTEFQKIGITMEVKQEKLLNQKNLVSFTQLLTLNLKLVLL